MLNIKEIYEEFDKIGSLSFTTNSDEGNISSRIAHFFAYDDDGIYLRTMHVKPFYKELKATGKLSVCGIFPKSQIEHDADNLPVFVPGITMRLAGDVRELTLDEVNEKAKTDRNFNVAIYDIKKYPAIRIFVMYRGKGEKYIYDFRKVNQDHKIERERFSFGGMDFVPPGLTITDDCIACGKCKESCTFDAICEGTPYFIMGNRCDECGNCFEVCPSGAVVSKGKA